MPAEPAMPCGTSSLIENALSPTPERGVSIVADFIAVSKESFVRFFGPSATVSVPLADVQMQAETVKPVIGSSTSDGGVGVVPMSAWTLGAQPAGRGRAAVAALPRVRVQCG